VIVTSSTARTNCFGTITRCRRRATSGARGRSGARRTDLAARNAAGRRDTYRGPTDHVIESFATVCGPDTRPARDRSATLRAVSAARRGARRRGDRRLADGRIRSRRRARGGRGGGRRRSRVERVVICTPIRTRTVRRGTPRPAAQSAHADVLRRKRGSARSSAFRGQHPDYWRWSAMRRTVFRLPGWGRIGRRSAAHYEHLEAIRPIPRLDRSVTNPRRLAPILNGSVTRLALSQLATLRTDIALFDDVESLVGRVKPVSERDAGRRTVYRPLAVELDNIGQRFLMPWRLRNVREIRACRALSSTQNAAASRASSCAAAASPIIQTRMRGFQESHVRPEGVYARSARVLAPRTEAIDALPTVAKSRATAPSPRPQPPADPSSRMPSATTRATPRIRPGGPASS